MKRNFLTEGVVLAIIVTTIVAFPAYGKHSKNGGGTLEAGISKKKTDGDSAVKPADSSTATNQQATFTVRASQIDEGRRRTSSLKAEAGKWVVIQVTTIEALRNSTDKRGKIKFMMQGGDAPSCNVAVGKMTNIGQTKKTAFKATSAGFVDYSSEGNFSVKVTMTLSDTQPEGLARAAGDVTSGSSADTTATVLCPQCHGTGTSTVRIDAPGGRSMSDRSTCGLCKGTGRCSESSFQWYQKSVIWAADQNAH